MRLLLLLLILLLLVPALRLLFSGSCNCCRVVTRVRVVCYCCSRTAVVISLVVVVAVRVGCYCSWCSDDEKELPGLQVSTK